VRYVGSVTPEELRERTTAFAADVLAFCRDLKRTSDARNVFDQLSDSGTAVAANYRCACRARSRREFISKLAIAVEEADETVGRLEIIIRSKTASGGRPAELLREARGLLAILAASRRTAERNHPDDKRKT
jgi:four helix bundle protein